MIKRVLIADDSATARMIIRRCLEITGCNQAEFMEARDGQEALEIARNNSVDLVVTDINMPNMDGVSLLKHIKASPRLNSMPVLVISSASNQARDVELLNGGAFAVVNKPVSPAAVAKAMKNFTNENEWGC
jgi:two-component system chemotaxis response regulator CheY